MISSLSIIFIIMMHYTILSFHHLLHPPGLRDGRPDESPGADRAAPRSVGGLRRRAAAAAGGARRGGAPQGALKSGRDNGGTREKCWKNHGKIHDDVVKTRGNP